VQFASDTETRLIVGVAVSNAGTDAGQLTPMLEQIADRTGGAQPAEYLVDGGYAHLASIDAAETRGITVYALVPTPHREGIDPHARKRDNTDRTATWRARTATDEAKRIYAERAATAETVHADQRAWRGLRQLPVRGLGKAWCIGLWAALLHNILRAEVVLRGGLIRRPSPARARGAAPQSCPHPHRWRRGFRSTFSQRTVPADAHRPAAPGLLHGL
jgi:hypothetical protein